MTFGIYALSLQERLNAMLDLNHLFESIACIQATRTSDETAREYGYPSWIDYCHKKRPLSRFVRVCPICKKSFTPENYAVGGHVLAGFGKKDSQGKLIYTKCVTPICNKCNVKAESQIKAFEVMKFYLCNLPPKQ